MPSHYELLGVDRAAGHEEIAKAYIRRTMDSRKAGFLRSGSLSRQDRQAIETAYEVLIDPNRRAAYDRSLDRP